MIFFVIDKEFANVFSTALCLEELYGKYSLTLFVAHDKAWTELYPCLFMFGVHCWHNFSQCFCYLSLSFSLFSGSNFDFSSSFLFFHCTFYCKLHFFFFVIIIFTIFFEQCSSFSLSLSCRNRSHFSGKLKKKKKDLNKFFSL